MRRRAEWHRDQTHLIADFYRIRRRVAYPLPIGEVHLPEMPVPGISVYPWSVWLLWDLEERIHSLGWAGEWFRDVDVQQKAGRDLAALASWPAYRQYDRPDLSLGHAGRLLWYALRSWSWVDDGLRQAIRDAMWRLVEDGVRCSDEMHGRFGTAEDILALDEPHSVLHNIPFIGTVGTALCAN